jgi:hypothetical protein
VIHLSLLTRTTVEDVVMVVHCSIDALLKNLDSDATKQKYNLLKWKLNSNL